MGQIYDHYMPDITVTAAGRDWKLKRASDFDSLWDEMVADGRADADEHIPYWTELWPSSIALCSWLSERRDEIAGRSCLDLGCGLGLTALAAASLGAMSRPWITSLTHCITPASTPRPTASARNLYGLPWTGATPP